MCGWVGVLAPTFTPFRTKSWLRHWIEEFNEEAKNIKMKIKYDGDKNGNSEQEFERVQTIELRIFNSWIPLNK